MGLQNSLTSKYSGSVVRTTHLTGASTDLVRDWLFCTMVFRFSPKAYVFFCERTVWLCVLRRTDLTGASTDLVRGFFFFVSVLCGWEVGRTDGRTD